MRPGCVLQQARARHPVWPVCASIGNELCCACASLIIVDIIIAIGDVVLRCWLHLFFYDACCDFIFSKIPFLLINIYILLCYSGTMCSTLWRVICSITLICFRLDLCIIPPFVFGLFEGKIPCGSFCWMKSFISFCSCSCMCVSFPLPYPNACCEAHWGWSSSLQFNALTAALQGHHKSRLPPGSPAPEANACCLTSTA